MTERKAQPKDEQEAADERAQAVAESNAQAEQRRADETVPGGRYVTADGRVVDANGKPLEGEK